MADDLLTLTVQNKKKKNTQVIVKEKVLTSECREKIADKETQKELKEKRSTEWKKKRESNSNKRKDKTAVQCKKANENASSSRTQVSNRNKVFKERHGLKSHCQYQHLKLNQTQQKKNV